jgi:uncharacterized protein YabE (DUF348 family)
MIINFKFMKKMVGNLNIKPKITSAVAALSLLAVLLVAGNTSAGSKIVSIYADGRVQTISTSKATVKDALEQAGIEILNKDSTEPKLTDKLGDNFNINVYRARMVTVIDASKYERVLTSGQSGKKIAEDAGIKVNPEDKYQFSRVDQFSGDIPIGEVLTIKRAKTINLSLYGKQLTLRTHASDVNDLLAEQDIKLDAADELSLAKDAKITEGVSLAINRVGKEVITVDEEIAFPEEIIKDADKETSYKQVQTPGTKGKKTVTYEVVKHNGQEVSRTAQNEVIITEPIKQVTVVGSKSPIPSAPSNVAGNVALGKELAAARGWGDGDQWNCLYNLWQRESGWRTEAHNPSGAHGIPQALPGSKMGAGWESDATVQINWGLGYIAGRYGTPCNAYNIQISRGWY